MIDLLSRPFSLFFFPFVLHNPQAVTAPTHAGSNIVDSGYTLAAAHFHTSICNLNPNMTAKLLNYFSAAYVNGDKFTVNIPTTWSRKSVILIITVYVLWIYSSS